MDLIRAEKLPTWQKEQPKRELQYLDMGTVLLTNVELNPGYYITEMCRNLNLKRKMKLTKKSNIEVKKVESLPLLRKGGRRATKT